MKRSDPMVWLALLAIVFIPFYGSGQNRCGLSAHEAALQRSNPAAYAERMQQREQRRHQYSHLPAIAASSTVHTIPVVVHLVYKNAAENLPDSVIFSQIDVLNEDFARLNADTGNTPAGFNVAGATSFRFCLAQRDENDNPTSGIERRMTTVPQFSDTTLDIYSFAAGGLDAWDVERYFNIWVCALDTSLRGFGEFPDISPHTSTYGAVVNYLFFGRGGAALAPYNQGRTATHEVGHCLGLHHIWGDGVSGCTDDDGVADTPLQSSATNGCRTFPAFDACTPGGNGVMFMNYMDNSNDACKNMFTLGQDGWMQFEMGFDFPQLLTSGACQPAVLTDNDIWLRAILAPVGQSCDLTANPAVEIKNYGTIPVTSVDFHYSFDGGPAALYSWSGSLPSLATTVVGLPSVLLPSGMHTLTVYTDNPNMTADPVNDNDTLSSAFELLGQGAGLPVTEGFEGAAFPPAGWDIVNPDGDYTWISTSQAARSGVNSVLMDNYYYSNTGQTDDLITGKIDLRSVTNPVLTFDVAYTFFYLGGPVPLISTDSLEVLISTDCGTTFSRIYYKGGSDLSTADSTNLYFVPASFEWRNELIPLSAWSGDSLVVFAFRNINGFGNSLYLDNINLTSATAIGMTAQQHRMSIFPNPSGGEVTADLRHLGPGTAELTVYDLAGKAMRVFPSMPAGSLVRLRLDELADGMYTVRVLSASGTGTVPLVIRH
jgi:hypothetical protein